MSLRAYDFIAVAYVLTGVMLTIYLIRVWWKKHR